MVTAYNAGLKTLSLPELMKYYLAKVDLDVVVANHRHIITDVVADVSHPVTRVLTMRVEIISGGFSLQHIATINQEHVTRTFLHHLRHKRMHPLETSLAPVVMTEVVREVISMHVRREDNLQMLRLCTHLFGKGKEKLSIINYQLPIIPIGIFFVVFFHRKKY